MASLGKCCIGGEKLVRLSARGGVYIRCALRMFENKPPSPVGAMSDAERGGGELIFGRIRYQQALL